MRTLSNLFAKLANRGQMTHFSEENNRRHTKVG